MIPHTSPDCLLIGGPDSVDERNIYEIEDIAKIQVTSSDGQKKRAIGGTRVVGMKSRTELALDGKGMGIDGESYRKNLKKFLAGKSFDNFEVPPSAQITVDIHRKTGLLIATEVCSPILQLAPLMGQMPARSMLPWNPAVNQLGWPLYEMGTIAKTQGWNIGIKNAKWLGSSVTHAESREYSGTTPLEKIWRGLATYTTMDKNDIYLIQRGIEASMKGDYRNLPIHMTARRTKLVSDCKMLFDPSHSLGPKMRLHIVAATIDALRIQMPDGTYLYDGALIEVGTAGCDAEQHITIDELREICEEVAKFRTLVAPKS